MELTQFVWFGGGTDTVRPDRWRAYPVFLGKNHDLDAFEDKVRADDRVEAVTHLGGAVDRRLYRIEWAEEMDGFVTALKDHDILVEQAKGNDDEWTFRLRAHNREPLAAFQAACTEQGITPRIRELHARDADDSD